MLSFLDIDDVVYILQGDKYMKKYIISQIEPITTVFCLLSKQTHGIIINVDIFQYAYQTSVFGSYFFFSLMQVLNKTSCY